MKLHVQRLLLRLGDLMSLHRGATAIEYGLILAAIAGVIVVVVTAIGGETGVGFGSLNNNYAEYKSPSVN